MDCAIQSKIFNKPLKEINFNSLRNSFIFQLPKFQNIQNFPKYNAIDEPEENNELKYIYKKRGRKNKNQNNDDNKDKTEIYVHNKFSSDNVKRKLKTLFHNYIIELLNNLLKQNNRDISIKFVKINSRITKDIGIEYNRNLLKKHIRNIIIDVSDKYQNKNNNIDCLKYIEKQKDNENINKILNMTYEDLYTNYYLKSIKNNKITSFEEHKEKLLKEFGNEYLNIFIENAKNFIDFFKKGKKRKSRKERKFDISYKTSENEMNETTNTNETINIDNSIENYYINKNMVSFSTQTDICNINTKIVTFT